MSRLEHPDHAPAPMLHEQLRGLVGAGASAVTQSLDALFAIAEDIRKIAGDSEQALYRYRDLAIEVGGLYEAIRGGRAWERPGG